MGGQGPPKPPCPVMSTSPPMTYDPSTRLRAPQRGFTLIEVLVALSAGVLVSMAAFMLSKDATRFFQHEARISSAQIALTLAMNRITGDIQRAGYLSTANIQKDPTVCAQTSTTWTAGLSLLAGVNIAPSTQSTPQSAAQTPALTPDQIILGGSMDSSEVYQVQCVLSGAGGGPLLVMRSPLLEPATYRANQSILGTSDTLAGNQTPFFYPSTYPTASITSGRFARIYQPDTNFQWFGVISTFTVDGTGTINVQLATPPTIPVKPTNTCGIALGDCGGGWLFSIVSRVKYDIRSLQGGSYASSQYAPVVQAVSPQVTGDSGRTELVRTELAADGTELTAATELVAEYAVDLRFGITASTMIQGDNYNPTVTTYGIGASQVYSIAGPVSSVSSQPELIRAVQVRLSTRTRAPDRDASLPVVAPDGRRLRFLISPTMEPAFARMRTIYDNVALPNQGGFSLW